MMTLQEARQHAEFSRIPEHVLAGVYSFVEHRADKESCATLRELVCFIHMEVPTLCYGNNAKVREWLFPQPKPCAEVPVES